MPCTQLPIEAFLEPYEPGEQAEERIEMLPLIIRAAAIVARDVMSGERWTIRGDPAAGDVLIIEFDEDSELDRVHLFGLLHEADRRAIRRRPQPRR